MTWRGMDGRLYPSPGDSEGFDLLKGEGVDDEEIERRLGKEEQGRCIIVGSSIHWANVCPYCGESYPVNTSHDECAGLAALRRLTPHIDDLIWLLSRASSEEEGR